MKIYQLEINHFRGIEKGTFNFTTPLVCLIGHGDTTKSTILDAIEYVLSPNWFIPIDDSDFTDCDTKRNIEITATVGPVPEEFMSISKYGQYLRVWNISENKLFDDDLEQYKKEDGNIYVLSVKLIIDNNLTPEWFVISNTHPEGVHIPHKDRQKIGVSRIGENIDNELAWTRGSSLLRFSQDKNQMEKILLDASRKLRETLPPNAFDSLGDSINMARTSGQMYGIKTDDFRANIDPKVLKGNSSTISLHDNTIPFRRMGTGTRRLMAIGLQLKCIEEQGGILLIDEIEHALEPHRLKYLLRILSQNAMQQNYGQIFMTTQNPATLEELGEKYLYCVHYQSTTRISHVIKISGIQGTVRRTPAAFLSPKLIVCEGATEIGLLMAFEESLIKKQCDNRFSFAYNKTAIIDGEGTSSSKRAFDLAIHNYQICLFVDSDRLAEWGVSERILVENSVSVCRWKDTNNTEMQLFADLPQSIIIDVIKIAKTLKNYDDATILQSINSKVGNKLSTLDNITTYPKEDLVTLRISIACSAKTNEWFKSINAGYCLGQYLFKNLEAIENTEFYATFDKIQKWVINGH